jgi:homoserine kinase type II
MGQKMAGIPVARGPKLRAGVSPGLFTALQDQYGLDMVEDARDLGGSSNLNLLLEDPIGGRRCVVRVYRPWVTASRLADMQLARIRLASGGIPCAQPVPTLSGESWTVVDGRLVEVEPYIEHDAQMNTWALLEAGLPLLGRIHSLLERLQVSMDGRNPPASNNIEPKNVPSEILRGVRQIRLWAELSPSLLQLAEGAEELAHFVAREQRRPVFKKLPRQLVHGDFWDNNVLFRNGQVVQIADFDFMGERARIDDLALTLYYTNSTFSKDRLSTGRMVQLRTLIDAYDSGLTEPLRQEERAALPLALCRAPLAFIAMIPAVDSESGARRLAEEMAPDIAWARAMAQDLEQWQAVFSRETGGEST